jgi:AcrR family transcriptional regulator
MGRRNEHSRDELQSLAIRAAREIVRTEGPAALSTRRLAAATGYSAANLYLIFRNLDELILRVNAGTLDELHARLQAVADSDIAPSRVLPQLADAYVRFAFEHWQLWSLVFERPRPADAPAWYGERIDRTFRFIEGQLLAAAPERDRDEVRLAATGLWSGVHGLCGLSLGGRLDQAGLAGACRAAEALVEVFVAGLRHQSVRHLIPTSRESSSS